MTGTSQVHQTLETDREVADDARRLGAVALSSPDLLAAAGR